MSPQGPNSTDPESTGSESTPSESTPSDSTSPESTSPESTGPEAAGSDGGGTGPGPGPAANRQATGRPVGGSRESRDANRPEASKPTKREEIKDATDVTKTSAQRIRDDGAAGKSRIVSGAREAAVKGAVAVGIPAPVARLALQNKKVVVALAVVSLAGPLLPLLVVVAMIVGGLSGGADDGGLASYDLIEEYIPSDVLAEYQIAASQYEDLPWTIIAAAGTLATEHGKLSPYPNDLCDRDPERPALRSTTANADGCGDAQTSVYETVEPAIGPGANEGRGPLLISPRAVRVGDFDPNQVTSIAAGGEDPQSSTDWIAFELDRIRSVMIEDEGWEFDPEDEASATALWSEATRRLAIIDPQTAACPASFLASTPGEETAKGISQMWRCELARGSESMVVLRSIDRNDKGEWTGELAGGTAIDALTSEGLAVAFGWSGYGARNTDASLCVAPVDDPDTAADESAGWTPAPLAGVFPLTEAIFAAYAERSDVAAGATRCDAAANIRAAVRALIAGESTPPEERVGPARALGDRSSETGTWNPVVGGWWAMPWALGTGGDLGDFFEQGPSDAYRPRSACFEAIDQWLVGVATDATVFAGVTTDTVASIDVPAAEAVLGGWPRSNDACLPAPDGDWERLVAAAALDRVLAVVAPEGDDEPTHGDAELAPGATPNYLPDVDPETGELIIDAVVTEPDVTEPVVSEPNVSEPIAGVPEGATPSETSPTTVITTIAGPPTADEAAAATLEGLAAYLRHRGDAAPDSSATPARAGTDMIPLRLSPTGRSLVGLPPEPSDTRPSYSQRIITLAIGIGGLVPDDSRYDANINPFDAAFAASAGGGSGSLPGIPEPMATAFANAPTIAKTKYPNCDLQVSLVAAIATVESKSYWDKIGPDGVANPWIIGRALDGTGGTIAQRDTEGGRLDRDTTWDRAVGPMQFIPTTWAQHGTDGNSDGIADPQNMFDSAASAAGKLCADAGNLSLQSPAGKQATILSYNRAQWYVDKVLAAEAQIIAAQAAAGPSITIVGNSGPISLVTVGGITVAAELGPYLEQALAAARADGVVLGGGGFRDSQGQIKVRKNNCGTSYYAIYEMPSGQCTPPTAKPGTSQHEKGLAVDFANCNDHSTACYQWLDANAGQFGLINYPKESWHWSTTGR